MIIKFPTGLYDLPSDPSNNTSVTFTVSNERPPRTNLVYPKIPDGLNSRKRVPRDLALKERRGSVGDLVFSVSRASRNTEGNNAKQFELGQILDFSDAPLQTVDPMLVSPVTETQHDLNRFDYESLGVSEAEQQLIADNSLVVHDNLMIELNRLKELRANTEVVINVQQKRINEANRNIDAMVIMAENTSDNVDLLLLVDKLRETRQLAFDTRDAAVAEANLYAEQAEDIVTKLRTVATVLK